MELIADGGSTKTDWCLITEDNQKEIQQTPGMNPYHCDKETMLTYISSLTFPKDKVERIEFYGSGCTPDMKHVLEEVLQVSFPDCKSITVDSDLVGAAKALCGTSEGIACILGTGANSGLFDGEKIIQNVSPMGYILGDEGSGAVIGRRFINELYKGGHRDMIPVFEQETGLNAPIIIQKVYREPMPNKFLASLSPFIAKHIDCEEWLDELITDCFRNFFRKNIAHYNRPDLKVGFVGSIAFIYQKQLKKAANLEGFEIGSILKSPLR